MCFEVSGVVIDNNQLPIICIQYYILLMNLWHDNYE
jgi:hypothetical protein